MTTAEALFPVANHSQENLIITTMSAVSDWPKEVDHPLVFHYIPSSMGQGPSLGLGLALAQPDRRVIVLNGDGCMLMNLGCLVTIGKLAPRNFSILVLDNGIYEVTGGQPHAGSEGVDYGGLARSAGIIRTHEFESAEHWTREAPSVLTAEGPVFVHLRVEPRFGRSTPKAPRRMPEQIERLRVCLGILPVTS